MIDPVVLVVPAVVWLGSMLLLWPTPATTSGRTPAGVLVLSALAATVAIFAPSAAVAYTGAAVSGLGLAWSARGASWTGALLLGLSGMATLGAAVAFLLAGPTVLPFALSMAALGLRCGVVPMHVGVAALSRQAPDLQSRQFATLLVLVFVHLRFADHIPAAAAAAPALVVLGALTAIVFALTALVQPTLRGFLEGSTLMHGGLVFAAVGAAARGHHAAALFACFTMALAVGGLGYVVRALEARVGPVTFATSGGRARAFPRLAAAFAVLGAAGVGMPGTAGFIADDLLLHALWEESVVATVTVALASALLAIATLRAIASIFFGRQVTSEAPDLLPGERPVAVAFIVLLTAIGLVPAVLTATAGRLFGAQ